MNSLYLGFSVVFPLFLMMALGYLLRRLGWVNEDVLEPMNKISFQVFLPVLLFVNVYNSDFTQDFQPKLLLFAVSCVVVCFALFMLVIPLIEKQPERRGVLVQGIFRSNYILFGLPVTASLFGADKVGVTAILVAFIVPLFNLLSVVALEVFRAGRIDVIKILKGIVTNPLILGSVTAFLFLLTGIRLPAVLMKTLTDISAIATPLALIILGGGFSFSRLKGRWRGIFIGVLGRLIVVPILFLPIAVAMGYRGIELGSILTMLSSPTAVSSFTMAQQMGGDGELAGQIVVIGSITSIFTIFMWVSALSSMGLLGV